MHHKIEKLYNTTAVSVVDTYSIELIEEAAEAIIDEWNNNGKMSEYWLEELKDGLKSLKDNKFT